MWKKWLCALPLLAACASTPSLTSVQSGMRPTEVQKLLGEPQDRSFQGSKERWVYPHETEGKVRVVVFDDNRVVQMSVNDAKDSLQTNVSGDAGLCTGTNAYGKFEEGGGCNMYGCWPAGGFCNGFGCTSSGRCSSKGCPKKIEAYRCTD